MLIAMLPSGVKVVYAKIKRGNQRVPVAPLKTKDRLLRNV